jgi:hypothetical protein
MARQQRSSTAIQFKIRQQVAATSKLINEEIGDEVLQSKSNGSENQFKKFKKARTANLNLCQEAENNNFLGVTKKNVVYYNLNFSVIMSFNATFTDSDTCVCPHFL